MSDIIIGAQEAIIAGLEQTVTEQEQTLDWLEQRVAELQRQLAIRDELVASGERIIANLNVLMDVQGKLTASEIGSAYKWIAVQQAIIGVLLGVAKGGAR